MFLKLSDMPAEIKIKIISYVQRPADLKALCLTSKLLQEFATPFLYRTVSLKLGGARDSHMIGLASRFNGGIQHTACLDLGVVGADYAHARRRTEEEEDDSQDSGYVEGSIKQAHLMVRMLLEALPRNKMENKLETFTYVNRSLGTFGLTLS